MYSENYSILRILSAKNMGNVKTTKLLRKMMELNQSFNDFIEEIDNDKTPNFISSELALSIKETKEHVDNYFLKLESNGIQIISMFNQNYPKSLLSKLKDKAPILLCCKGNLELLNEQCIGFCGSRTVTEKGLNAVTSIIDYINDKAIYVSGYAKGVDLKAHAYSLSKGLKTIIVLPEGILNFKVKSEIKPFIDWNRTLVISEFLPTSIWSVGNAMQRNSTIIGLSKAMVLIEAKDNGGSFNAGLKTLELEIPLFTTSYGNYNEFNKGNYILAKQGAKAFGLNKTTKKPSLGSLIELLQNPFDNVSLVKQIKLFA